MANYGVNFRVVYLNGSARQQALLEEAMQECVFPWERLKMTVYVQWLDDPEPGIHYEAASTIQTMEGFTQEWPPTATFEALGAGGNAHQIGGFYYPMGANWPYHYYPVANIKIANSLSDDETPGKLYVSDEFYKECVIHEMAHAIGGLFTEVEIGKLCSLLGIPREQWSTPTNGQRDDWMKAGIEAYAEIFKDIFLPSSSREYDNRTEVPLPKESFNGFLDVLQTFVGYTIMNDRWTFGGTFESMGYADSGDGDGDLLFQSCFGACPANGVGMGMALSRILGTVVIYSAVEFEPGPGLHFDPADPWVTYDHPLGGAYTAGVDIALSCGAEYEVLKFRNSPPDHPFHQFTPVPGQHQIGSGGTEVLSWQVSFSTPGGPGGTT